MSPVKRAALIILGTSLASTLFFNLLIYLFSRDNHGYYKIGMMIFTIIAIPISVALSSLLNYLASKGRILHSQAIKILALIPIIGIVGHILAKSDMMTNLMFWSGWLWFVLWLNTKFLKRDFE